MPTVAAPRAAEVLEQLGKAGDGKPPLGCMQCGLCSASCPLGSAMEFPPRKLILQAAAGNLDKVLASPVAVDVRGLLYLLERCPRGIELTDALWPALRDAAMQQGFQPPAELQETFQNISSTATRWAARRGNAWIGPRTWMSACWTSPRSRPVEALWLVGCYPSYYPRNQVVARAFARLLTEFGVTWGVLGAQEKAMGECDRMFGEEGLFETLVEANRKLLDKQDFRKLVVLDPHAFHALEKYYPRFGAWYRCSTTPRSSPSAWSNSSR